MSNRLPLIELPIGQPTRGLGELKVLKEAQKIALPLSAVDIQAKVANRVASVTLTQTFRNSYSEHLEAVYIFPLSPGSAVSNFELRVAGRVIKGKVEERAQARQQYQQALQDGKRAALLEQERDDVFTVQVGNLPPGEEVSVLLTYSERLPYFEDGRTELRLPLVVAPRYIPGGALPRNQVGHGTALDTDAVPDASRITPPLLAQGLDPQTSLNVQVELIQDDDEKDGIDDLSCSQHATKIGLANGNMQVSLAKEDERLNRDFVLQWHIASASTKSNMLIFKDADGEHYAMLSIMPPKKQGYLGAPRDVLFLVDRSGSMMGTKMISAARACSILLGTLGPQDRFAIQAFDDQQEWLLPAGQTSRSGDYFVAADEPGLERGYKYLRDIAARGGTEMYTALGASLQAIQSRTDAYGRVPVLVVLTDGEVGDESRILKRIQQELGDTRLFTVGIDTAVNDGLLKRCANLGGGTATFVVPGTALEQALLSVGREIGCPLVIDLEIEDSEGKIEQGSFCPDRMPDLFDGRAVTAFFKLSHKGALRVRGSYADGKPFSEKVRGKVIELPAIAQLWAKTHVQDLEDRYRLQPQLQQKLQQNIVAISCKHSLLTKFTAFVVVDESEVVNKTGQLRTIVQPVEEPADWGMFAKLSAPMAGGWGAAPPAGAPAPASAPMPQQQASPYRAMFKAREAQAELEVDGSAQESTRFRSASGGGGWGQSGSPGSYGSAPAPSGMPRSEGMPQVDPAAQLKLVEQKLKELKDALERAFEEVKSGKIPSVSDELETIRKSLLGLLSSLTFGTQVPSLQKFLRSGAIEMISSLKTKGVTAAGLQPLWERHMQALTDAEADATNKLKTSGTSSGGKFWESSI